MIIAFTGHRPSKLGWGYDLHDYRYKYLFEILKKHIESHNATHLITGMALGVDTVAAFASIRYRDENLDRKIVVECAIPCLGQEKLWSEKDQKIYHHLLNRADIVHYVSNEPYHYGVMQRRNHYMVDKCHALAAVWDGTNGGTKNCIRYANKKRKEVWRIDPTMIRS